ncbi:hypothetical protein ACOMHN_030855 [Nucella lapillus]
MPIIHTLAMPSSHIIPTLAMPLSHHPHHGYAIITSSPPWLCHYHIIHTLAMLDVPSSHLIHTLVVLDVPSSHIIHTLAMLDVPSSHIIHTLAMLDVPLSHHPHPDYAGCAIVTSSTP